MAVKDKYSAKELAAMQLPGLPTNERRIRSLAKKQAWVSTKEPCRGGYIKQYIFALLPKNIRMAIAAKAAIEGLAVSSTCEGATAGHKLALKLRADLARHQQETQIIAEQGLAAYNRLPAAKKQIVDSRYEILKARDAFIAAAGLPLKKGSIAFADHYKDGGVKLPEVIRTIIGKSLSWSTMNRWQQAHKTHGLVGLAPGYNSPNKGRSTLSPAQRELVTSMLTQHPHVSIIKIKEAMEARFPGEALPHISSIRRYVKKWQQENASLILYMSNPDAWKNKYQFALGDASEHVDRLNQVWEFDSTPTDVMLADGRHAIIGVIDIYSRRLKLLVSPTSKSSAVAAITRSALLDWGVPEIAKTDNGADYVSKHMTRVFESLELEQILCPPFTPECKPHIERAFKTFSHDIVELMPGYVGHNVNDRKAIEARRSFAHRLMKVGGDPVECKQLTAEELQSLCDRWCTAMYEQNPHGGLNGKTPAEMARAWQEPVRKIADIRALDILLAEAPQGGGMRRITKAGVSVDNVTFISDDMAGHEGEEVQVLLDATDLGTIYLFAKDDDGNLNYLCTAVDPMRTGHDRAEIAAKTRARQKRIMQDGSRELKKIARKTAVDDIYTEILEHREGQIANITPLPHKTVDYSNRALEEAAKAVSDRDNMRHDQDDMEELLNELSQERAEEATQVAKKKKKGIVHMFGTMTERYQYIRDRERSAGGLTIVEVEFLDEFYQTKQGSTFMDLEGDLRDKYGFAEAKEL